MTRAIPLGTHRNILPIPPVMAATTLVEAGCVQFGIEYRILNESTISPHYSPDVLAEQIAELDIGLDQVDDQGISMHVFDAATGDEYLRFDAFADPHYHYITPHSHHLVVQFDNIADPDFIAWTLARLEFSLPSMLAHAGADDLASAIDPLAVQAALVEVRGVISEARAASTPERLPS